MRAFLWQNITCKLKKIKRLNYDIVDKLNDFCFRPRTLIYSINFIQITISNNKIFYSQLPCRCGTYISLSYLYVHTHVFYFYSWYNKVERHGCILRFRLCYTNNRKINGIKTDIIFSVCGRHLYFIISGSNEKFIFYSHSQKLLNSNTNG